MAIPRTPTGPHSSTEYATRPPAPVSGQLDANTLAYFEGRITELFAQLEAAITKTQTLRVETREMAALSGKLHEAEQTLIREREERGAAQRKVEAERDRAKRRAKATGWGAAGALGSVIAIFATCAQGYRDTREIATKAATETAEVVATAKAAPAEVRTITTDVRVKALEERQGVLEQDVAGIRTTTTRILELLEPPTAVRVPKVRR